MSDEQTDAWQKVCATVEQLMGQTGTPGVAVGVLHNGEMQTAGFGITSVENPLPVTDTTLFQIGSITKTYVGTAVMRLVEMGKLDLDAPLRTYIPKFRVADKKVSAQLTLRHLFTHMAGWDGDRFEETGAGDDALARYTAELAELEQVAPLGEVWSYNNAGFSVAGYVIELVTGKPFAAAMQELVFGPLALETTFFDPAEVMTRRFAMGHHVEGTTAGVLRPWPLTRACWPMGGIATHVRDLLTYANFHLGDGATTDGTRLLSAQSLGAMQTPQVTVWGKESWGITWALNDTHGVREVSHGGGTFGHISLLVLVPERRFAVAVLTNAFAGGQITDKVYKAALQAYLGIEAPDPKPMETTPEELAAYAGHYTRPGADLDLAMVGSRLVGIFTPKTGFPTRESPLPPPEPPSSLTLCEPDRLLVVDGPAKEMVLDVIRRADGKIGWVRAGRLQRRVDE